MKGRRLFWYCSILILVCTLVSTQNTLYNNILPSVSGDSDNERIIQVGGAEFIEQWNEMGYLYRVSFTLKYEPYEIDGNNDTLGFVGLGWTVGTNIYTYFDVIHLNETKQGEFNFTTYEPISSCFTFKDGLIIYHLFLDFEPLGFTFGSCVIPVDDIYRFDFMHYLFTDYAMYGIQYDVDFCRIINQTMDPGWTTAYGSVHWNIDKVAIFNMSSDTTFSKLNATPHICFSVGYCQQYVPIIQILTNGTDIPGNGTLVTTPSHATWTNLYTPHQVYYYLKLESSEAGVTGNIPVSFVPPEYLSKPSDWSLLPGWAKFTIIGGSISLCGWCVFVGFIALKLMKNMKLLERKHSWKEGIDS